MKNFTNKYKALFTALALVIGFTTAAQKSPLRFDQMEVMQDSVETLYGEIYNIIEFYPDMAYSYEFNGDELASVSIAGVDDDATKALLENKLIQLEKLKQRMFNVSNRMGIYYVAETNATPANGYDTFYKGLRENLEYPDQAEEYGIEGTVFVKFIVDSNGNISQVTSAANFQSEEKWLTEKLLNEAEEAVKATSGKWDPARVGGIPVAHWVVIPIQFTIDHDYYHPMKTRYSG